MAFTYAGTLATDLDKVRFYINDVTENSGPKPGGGNFTDAELTNLVTAEGSWRKAVAAAFETLAAAWSTYVDTTVGPRRQSLSQVADAYRDMAKQWRKLYGAASSSGTRAPTRIDGYSDDVAADEV
jgi:hypothetical protein